MSDAKCRACGSTEIETDPARGDAVCTNCGVVLEDQLIVNETTFEETSSGGMALLGHFVSSDSTGGPTHFGGTFQSNGKESREITTANAKRGISLLCHQLDLTTSMIDMAVNFYRMALHKNLTRGRKQQLNHAACVYITCRMQKTSHMLIDISDVLQICVHELGRTYLKFAQALCIQLPTIDPCIYVMRFVGKLEFGKKSIEVETTANRLLARMKRDSIHSGRRPSGVIGAALLIAARLHDFNRSPADIVKIVKVHESTLRKRLIEFGETPSSALTLEEFMHVDLEEEQDPPSFKMARKKDKERLKKLENVEQELDELQKAIMKQLEKRPTKTMRHIFAEETDADKFIRESNINIIQDCLSENPDDAYNRDAEEPVVELGPDIASMGLSTSFYGKENATKEKRSLPFENISGELDLTGLDDEELDSYIMSEKESLGKVTLWNDVNAQYLKEQQEKEEKRLRELEEGKPEKKRRRTNRKKNNQTPANSAGEAIEKMLQEKRISNKINYEVLKSLDVGLNHSNPPAPDSVSSPVPAPESPFLSPVKMERFSYPSSPAKPKSRFERLNIGATPKFQVLREDVLRNRKKSNVDSGPSEPAVEPMESDNAADIVDDADDYDDEEEEPEPAEVGIKDLLGGNNDEDDFDDYDEEEY
ncbi:transcription factor IIIB 90 kDa subunit [Belonocnema kinseyi]|uniref:transcription factor IIIB 90 kDa subunit n=1 Tax=Belonocnema kinseyi TaxID=2817044 RepID=UPI00143CC5AB|nr:transcription factor IIIB 90 kDa subunit [Belonocnema kinseyi]